MAHCRLFEIKITMPTSSETNYVSVSFVLAKMIVTLTMCTAFDASLNCTNIL